MKKICLFLLGVVFLSSSLLAANNFFPDVMVGDWFHDYVMEVKDWGIIKGRGDGTFAPNANINRAEFTKMIVLYDERVDEKIANIDLPAMPEVEGKPYTMMYLQEFPTQPENCPSGWTEMDYGISWKDAGNSNWRRVCYTEQACSVAYLQRFNAEPNECPSRWNEANYGVHWSEGGRNKYGRVCYICS